MSGKRNVRVLRARLSHGCGASLWAMALAAIFACSTHAQGPEDDGKWEEPPGGYDWPVEAMHAAHLSTGKILVWQNPNSTGCVTQQSAWLWNPVDGALTNVGPNPPTTFQSFDCAAHAALSNGSILVAGGGCGPANAHEKTAIFSIAGPALGPWTEAATMNSKRWYATCTTLPDARVLAISGVSGVDQWGDDIYVTRPEIYTPGTPDTWVEMGQSADKELPAYPLMFVLPQQDQVFFAGPGQYTYTLDLAQPETWSLVDDTVAEGYYGLQGSAVMYEPGKVLKCGGRNPNVSPPTRDTLIIDLTDLNVPDPQWELVDPMQYERQDHNLLVLPNGKILAVGGRYRDIIGNWVHVFAAEWFDPTPGIEVWDTLAAMNGDPRHHHSTAVLLASAKVLVCGGDEHQQPPISYESAEIFSPPYLFTGTPRPTIGYAPTVVKYGTQFSVIRIFSQNPEPPIEMVSLVRLAAVTHGFDQDQRFVSLNFEVVSSTDLKVTAPADGNFAPPGYYMLFLVTDEGVPSTATYLRLE